MNWQAKQSQVVNRYLPSNDGGYPLTRHNTEMFRSQYVQNIQIPEQTCVTFEGVQDEQ